MPSIGRGFDSVNKSPKSFSIFGNSMTVKGELTTSFDFHFKVFRNVTDFKESFKLTSEFGVPIASSVNLNAALEVSRALALDQDVSIYVMHVSGVRKRQTVELDEEKFATDAHFQHSRAELSKNSYDFCSKYGDAFVKRLIFGAEVALVIKFKRSILERSKRVMSALHVNLSGGPDLQQAITFLRDLVMYDLECDIYTQTKGFSPDQLPPGDPKKLSDLSNWLADFSEKFHQIPAESFQTPIAYEIVTYGTILPEETVAIIEHTAIRAKYFFAIFRCSNAIDYYIRYFEWIGNTEQLNLLQLTKQELDDIKGMFDIKQDLTEPEMIRYINKLKVMITTLNGIVIPPRLIDEFTAADLERNRTFGSWKLKQCISPPFHMPEMPDEFVPDTLMVEVIKDDHKPLKGNLSLLYSFNDRVPFGEASHEIARQINLGTRNFANIPPAIGEDSRFDDLNFAYHLEIRKSALSNMGISPCLSNTCIKTPADDFRIKTYMVGKKPGIILGLE